MGDGVLSGYPISEQVLLPSIQPLGFPYSTHSPLSGVRKTLSTFWLILCQNLLNSLIGEPPSPTHPTALTPPLPSPTSTSPRWQVQSYGPSTHGWEEAKPKTQEDEEMSEHSPSAGCRLSVSASVGSSGQQCDFSPFSEPSSHHQMSPGKQK